MENCPHRIRVVVNDLTIADSTSAQRILETSHPPVYYIPPGDVNFEYLRPEPHQSWCEWKGAARYFAVVLPEKTVQSAAWHYPKPIERYADLANYIAFYPSKMDACYVNDEEVQSQEGDFYGGWITSNIIGPFKGAPGTYGW